MLRYRQSRGSPQSIALLMRDPISFDSQYHKPKSDSVVGEFRRLVSFE